MMCLHTRSERNLHRKRMRESLSRALIQTRERKARMTDVWVQGERGMGGRDEEDGVKGS